MYLSSRKILSNKNHPSTMLVIIPLLYMEGLAVDLEDIYVSYHSQLFSLFICWFADCVLEGCFWGWCTLAWSVPWFFGKSFEMDSCSILRDWHFLFLLRFPVPVAKFLYPMTNPKLRPLPQSDFLTREKSALSMPVARVPRCVRVITSLMGCTNNVFRKTFPSRTTQHL